MLTSVIPVGALVVKVNQDSELVISKNHGIEHSIEFSFGTEGGKKFLESKGIKDFRAIENRNEAKQVILNHIQYQMKLMPQEMDFGFRSFNQVMINYANNELTAEELDKLVIELHEKKVLYCLESSILDNEAIKCVEKQGEKMAAIEFERMIYQLMNYAPMRPKDVINQSAWNELIVMLIDSLSKSSQPGFICLAKKLNPFDIQIQCLIESILSEFCAKAVNTIMVNLINSGKDKEYRESLLELILGSSIPLYVLYGLLNLYIQEDSIEITNELNTYLVSILTLNGDGKNRIEYLLKFLNSNLLPFSSVDDLVNLDCDCGLTGLKLNRKFGNSDVYLAIKTKKYPVQDSLKVVRIDSSIYDCGLYAVCDMNELFLHTNISGGRLVLSQINVVDLILHENVKLMFNFYKYGINVSFDKFLINIKNKKYCSKYRHVKFIKEFRCTCIYF